MSFLNQFKQDAQAAENRDHTKTEAGGGGYEAPPEGTAMARLVGYIELGKHETTWQGKPKVSEYCRLIFELFGKKYPPKEVNGKMVPQTITIDEKLSFTDKSNWPKLFAKLNYSNAARNPAELLDTAYLLGIRHKKWPRKGQDKNKPETWTGLDVTIRAEDGSYSVRPPMTEVVDEEGGVEQRKINVPPATVPFKGFLWNRPTIEQWETIFIDGEWPERKDASGKVTKAARSKNVDQLKIRAALNYAGSPINHLLASLGKGIELGETTDPDMDDDYEEQSAPAPAPTPAPATQKPAKGADMGFDDDIPF